MPIIEATITEGRDPETVRSFIHELTYAAHRALDAPLESIRVIVREVPPTNFAAGDVTIVERRAAAE